MPAEVAAVSSAPATAHLSGRDPFLKESPAKIMTKSIRAAKSATSVHVRGTIVEAGETWRIDARLRKTQGTVRIIMSKSGTIEIIRYDKALFLRGDAKFWKVSLKEQAKKDPRGTAVAMRAFVGKWIQFQGKSPDLKAMVQAASLGSWVSDLEKFRATKRVAGKAVGAMPTVGLAGTAGSQREVVYVAARGVPYPMSEVANNKSCMVTYTEWNKPVRIAKPKPVAVIPL
jgi:hypothetical protein